MIVVVPVLFQVFLIVICNVDLVVLFYLFFAIGGGCGAGTIRYTLYGKKCCWWPYVVVVSRSGATFIVTV